MNPHDLSDLLLELYRAAQTHTLLQFPNVMIQWLQSFVEFDKAMFGLISEGATDQNTIHYVHLKNEKPAEFSEWMALKKDDFLLKMCCAQPDSAQYFSTQSIALAPAIRDFVMRNEHHHVLAVATSYGSGGVQAGVSLRRADKRRHFQPNEARDLERILPHAVEAFRINRALFSKNFVAQASEAYRGSCVYDDFGIIHFQCTAFTQLSSALFVDFEHYKVPKQLSHGFLQDRFRERHFVFSRRRVGPLNFVQVRTHSPLESLSEQELRVAKFYGTGLSAKELADELGIAPSTARRHIEAIYVKLNIRSKADLAFLIHAHAGGNDMQKLLHYFECS